MLHSTNNNCGFQFIHFLNVVVQITNDFYHFLNDCFCLLFIWTVFPLLTFDVWFQDGTALIDGIFCGEMTNGIDKKLLRLTVRNFRQVIDNSLGIFHTTAFILFASDCGRQSRWNCLDILFLVLLDSLKHTLQSRRWWRCITRQSHCSHWQQNGNLKCLNWFEQQSAFLLDKFVCSLVEQLPKVLLPRLLQLHCLNFASSLMFWASGLFLDEVIVQKSRLAKWKRVWTGKIGLLKGRGLSLFGSIVLFLYCSLLGLVFCLLLFVIMIYVKMGKVMFIEFYVLLFVV